MKKYTLPINWVQTAVLNVEAESLKDAVKILESLDNSTCAMMGATIPNSLRVVFPEIYKYVPNEVLYEKATLYISSRVPRCPHCEAARKYMREHDIEFEEIDIAKDEKARARLQKQSGSLAIPQIKIGNEISRGFTLPAFEKIVEKYKKE